MNLKVGAVLSMTCPSAARVQWKMENKSKSMRPFIPQTEELSQIDRDLTIPHLARDR